MNSHSKIHQALLDEWSVRIADQVSSGLTIREWCQQNNFSVHKYNYWKHLIKEELTDKVLPDIVPISVPIPDTVPSLSHESRDSYNSCNFQTSDSISLTINDISITLPAHLIGSLSEIIREVRNAQGC